MICFALFTHGEETALANQVENIRRFNPGCKIVLYNGSTDKRVGHKLPLVVCPYSRPLPKGKTGRFLVDIMRWLVSTDFRYDYLVQLDPGVMFLRTGFAEHVEHLMQGYDGMGINMGVQRSPEGNPHWEPGQSMWREWNRWQPYFGTAEFCGTLQAMQAYRRETIERIVPGLDLPRLEDLLAATEVVALEEILPVTLALRSGARLCNYPPESAEFVRPGVPLEIADLLLAQRQPHVYLVHPVPDSPEDPARQWLESLQPEPFPSNLTITWSSQQSGVDAALLHRLQALNALGLKSHAFFFRSGAGLHQYSAIPYAISNQADDLATYIRRESFDAVTFLNTLQHLDVLQRIGFRGKAIYEFHGRTKAILEDLRRINEREDGGRIDAIVVPSDHVAEIANTQLYRRTDLPIYVARSTLDAQFFGRQPYVRLLTQYRIPEEWTATPLLGFVGRLDSNKNWRLLLRVFRRLRLKQKMRLLIASDLTKSPEVNEFYQEAAKQHLLGDLLVLPNVAYEKMPQFYSLIAGSGGVLLSTSFQEGYPYHLLEAQACHCPIVCTAISGSQEVVQHNVTGLTFPAGKSSLGALYVQRLITNKALRKKITANARNLIKRRNAVEHNVRAYAEWLRDLF